MGDADDAEEALRRPKRKTRGTELARPETGELPYLNHDEYTNCAFHIASALYVGVPHAQGRSPPEGRSSLAAAVARPPPRAPPPPGDLPWPPQPPPPAADTPAAVRDDGPPAATAAPAGVWQWSPRDDASRREVSPCGTAPTHGCSLLPAVRLSQCMPFFTVQTCFKESHATSPAVLRDSLTHISYIRHSWSSAMPSVIPPLSAASCLHPTASRCHR